MSWLQALLYFHREALVSLTRSWKVSVLAIATIATSLFIGGSLLLVAAGLEDLVERWRSEPRVILYLTRGATAEDVARLRQLGAAPWLRGVEAVSPETATRRFRETFPSLADLLDAWGDQPLPASLELRFDPDAAAREDFTSWVARLRADRAVEMLDDDRDWLAQLATLVRVVRTIGLTLGAVLLAAASFTIASVVRLTAHLYRDEVAVMRLVGATEFFVRGPFYVEGAMQGTAGGLIAAAGLWAGHRLFHARAALHPDIASAIRFLRPGEIVLLVGLGAAAGLAGAIVSLRREPLADAPAA